ncbi:hypothetical protein [Streptomyces phaeoluteigriseus]
MRRTPSRGLFAAAMLAASVLAPMTAVPATAVPAAGVVRYDGDECPPDGLGPELTARLDRAIEDVRRTAGIPGVIAGLWMPGKGSYVRATGVADTATGQPMTTEKFEVVIALEGDAALDEVGQVHGVRPDTVRAHALQAAAHDLRGGGVVRIAARPRLIAWQWAACALARSAASVSPSRTRRSLRAARFGRVVDQAAGRWVTGAVEAKYVSGLGS